MPTTSKTLVTNQTVSTPLTSPSAKLSGNQSYWLATLDTTAHTGVVCDFTIQGSPDNSTWTDVSNNSLTGGDGTGKFGTDTSNQVQTFSLENSQGPWWRTNVTNVVGSFVINSLVVTNSDIP